MNNAERIVNLTSEQYQELFATKKETFDKMLEIMKADYRKKHQRGGRPSKLSVLDKLIIMLYYKSLFSISPCTVCAPHFQLCCTVSPPDFDGKNILSGEKSAVKPAYFVILNRPKEYRVMECIAFDYGVRKSMICDAIHY